MIELAGATKNYPSDAGSVCALDDVSLHIRPAEFVAICGPSGCGKSTLLSLAGGLTQPTSGSVRVAGHELTELSSAALARFRSENLGFVFQMFHLLPYLDVTSNVLVSATRASDDIRQRAQKLLEDFGLQDRLSHRPGQLSAGERQRVAMARALLNDPKVLLADEPTGNLDPKSAAVVLELLKKFQSAGGTVLMVTHDQQAANAADRVVQLASGKVVVEDTALTS